MASIAIILLSVMMAIAAFMNSSKLDQQASSQALVQNSISSQQTTALAEGLIKSDLLGTMRKYGLNGVQLSAGLRCALDKTQCPTVLPTYWGSSQVPIWAKRLTTPHSPPNPPSSVSSLNSVGTLQVTAVSPASAYSLTADFTVTPPPPSPQNLNQAVSPTLHYKVDLGSAASFKNAMVGNTFQCTLCHAEVYGNISEYWNHIDYGNANLIHGTYSIHLNPVQTWYQQVVGLTGLSPNLPTVSYTDDITDKVAAYYHGINLSTASTNDDVLSSVFSGPTPNSYLRAYQTNYSGPLLPFNAIRQDYVMPKLDPTSMLPLMTGTISSASANGILKVPYGTNSNPTSVTGGTINGVYEGNLILNGRTPNTPLRINGRVFVRGDVVIFGKVTGNGEIYSGRNIYVADDLTYANQPTQFDGSQASNQQMTYVGDSSVNGPAQQLSNAMQGKDRLGLFATNNIVIGDPFSEGLFSSGGDSVQDDVRYLVQIGLGNLYSGANSLMYSAPQGVLGTNLAFDPSTGYMLDQIFSANGQPCYLDPWTSPSQCVSQSDPNFSNKVQVTQIFKYPSFSAAQSEAAYYNDLSVTQIPKGYSLNFLPNNVVSGSAGAGLPLAPWITSTAFLNLTQNSLTKSYNTALPGQVSSHLRPLSLTFPIQMAQAAPSGKSGYTSDYWASGTELVATLDSWTGSASGKGIFSYLATLPAQNDDPLPGKTVADRFVDFVNLCNSVANGTSSFPGAVTSIKGGTPASYLGSPPTNSLWCQFWYNPTSSIPLPPGITPTPPRTQVDIRLTPSSNLTGSNYSPNYSPVCTDLFVQKTGGAMPITDLSGSPAPPCQSTTRVDERVAVGWSSFYFSIVYSAGYATSVPMLRMVTQFYDPSVTRAKNKVQKIQAFLFANQFVSYAYNGISDRQLRVDGGIVAKDLIGRFVSGMGPERTYSPGYANGIYPSFAQKYNYGTEEVTPALIVTQDPRFQYETQFLDSNFGHILLSY